MVTNPSKFRPPNILEYRSGDFRYEEIQRIDNHKGSTGGGRRHHGPGSLPEKPDRRTDFLLLAEQIR